MLNSLKISNFRSLSKLEIKQLGRVNLIVGKNNSGKSSLLEAIRIYAGRANPALLREIAISHGERHIKASSSYSEKTYPEGKELPFQAFFSGREIPNTDDSPIYIGDIEEKSFVKIEHALYIDEFEEVEDHEGDIIHRRKRNKIEKDTLFTVNAQADQALLISSSESESQGWIELNDSPAPRRNTIFWDRVLSDIPLSYVPTQFLSLDYLAQLWDQIVLTPHEESVKKALRIVEKNVEELAFIQSEMSDSRISRRSDRSERTAKIKLKGFKNGVPLNSMGDGMLRVLQLALTIFPARNGFLLIDEFENGLHWTVQEKIWRLIFELATELNIQVFATSHSNDAVKGFAVAANDHPQLGMLIKLSKNQTDEDSSQSFSIAASLDENSLLAASNAEIDLR
ncbi:MAG: AAA family ATPase [Hydrogenophaga sp.]|nr:AAA family ATPase [Hydrogenophaga sp.]